MCFDCLLIEDQPDPARTYSYVPAALTLLVYDPGVAQWRPLDVELEWDGADPHAITLVVAGGTEDETVWSLGRDLLRAGLHRPVGVGDVSVLPDPQTPWVCELVLSSPDGRATLRVERLQLEGFLAAVEREIAYAAVPADPWVG